MDGETSRQLLVKLAEKTGALKYGAIGFLYGLGKEEVPSQTTLALLRPQVAAQKPENGLQHPNGDALNVASTFQAAGGREIEIYLQDVYAQWPYEQLGLEDYKARIEPILRGVLASPNPGLFSFVPINEPDQIWYNLTDRRQALLDAWKELATYIRSVIPGARLVGPNFALYNGPFYREFLAFGLANDCLPDVISWHELNDDFHTGWYQRYEEYRGFERELGIAPREICINEYARIKGDLTVPGKLVQWIARFETSKVDACLAYWTDAGSLNNLVTPDHHNKPTGAWWLYRWYSEMSGETVRVVPPQVNAEGLQGLAAFDPSIPKAFVVFGGASGAVEVVVDGVDTALFGKEARVRLYATAASGLAPTGLPELLLESEFPVVDGQVRLTLADAQESSAYLMLVLSGERPTFKYDYALPVETSGLYDLKLRCAASGGLRLSLNAGPEREALLPDGTAEITLRVFLRAGLNQLRVAPESSAGPLAAKLIPSGIAADVYEAEAPANLLGGAAARVAAPAASGGWSVEGIGDGPENTLTFTGVRAPAAGRYYAVVYFANGEFRGGHSYNSQVVDRRAEVSVNGESPRAVYFRNTFDWNVIQDRVIAVDLKAGENTITFSNPEPGAFAPVIDRVEIFAAGEL